jgi:hypothetical protein
MPEERMDGRPTLVIERVDAPPLFVLGVGGVGVLQELAYLLAAPIAGARDR